MSRLTMSPVATCIRAVRRVTLLSACLLTGVAAADTIPKMHAGSTETTPARSENITKPVDSANHTNTLGIEPVATLPVALGAPVKKPPLPVIKLTPSAPLSVNAPSASQPAPAPKPTASVSRATKKPINPTTIGPLGVPLGFDERIAHALRLADIGDPEAGMSLCRSLAENPDLSRAQLAKLRSCALFDVPLVQLRQLMTSDRMQAADRLVDTMLKSARGPRRDYLLTVKAETSKRAVRKDPESAGNRVMIIVGDALDRYHKERGSFPRSYAELNDILPPNAPPLVDYDIVNYAVGNGGYAVAIRNRAEPREVLTLQKTGLIE